MMIAGYRQVLHTNEGRDDQGKAWFDQSWKAVAKRFASTGRHQHKDIVSWRKRLPWHLRQAI